MSRRVFCQKLKLEAEGLDKPPYPGAVGLKIFENISKQAWKMWLDRQTMFINEYRLNMIDPKARQFLLAEMEKFLFSDDAEEHPPGYVQPT
jgi:Fe-S cluster biosynthesis and repair protein YggX